MSKRMNLLFHLFMREQYGYTAVRGKIHHVELNCNINNVPPELL